MQKQARAKLKKSKYGNVKSEFNGIKFDSKKEMQRYLELKGMLDAGLIKDLKLQPHFTLQEAFKTPEGETIQKIGYIADFSYIEDGKYIIEDVKSKVTAENTTYKLKKKLMADKGFYITEV